MIYLALLSLLVAAGLLTIAIVTGSSVWSWASFGASAAAALVLVVRWVRRLRAERRAAAEPDFDERDDDDLDGADAADTEVLEPSTPRRARRAESDVEPDEEDTDAADLLVVSELSVRIVVVDERPRYHLRRCRWLGDREIIPLPIDEARQLGFTPCARCTPDAVLARRHRAAGATYRAGAGRELD